MAQVAEQKREKISRNEAARRLGVSWRIVQNWVDSGKLKPRNFAGGGRVPWFYWDEVEPLGREVEVEPAQDDRGAPDAP